jgi:hypothetical protein
MAERVRIHGEEVNALTKKVHHVAFKPLPCESSSKEWKEKVAEISKVNDVAKHAAFCADYISWIYADVPADECGGRKGVQAYTAWWSTPAKDGTTHLQKVPKALLNHLHAPRSASWTGMQFDDIINFVDEAGIPVDVRWFLDRARQKERRAKAAKDPKPKGSKRGAEELEEYIELEQQKQKEPVPEPTPARRPCDEMDLLFKGFPQCLEHTQIEDLVRKFKDRLGTSPLNEEDEEEVDGGGNASSHSDVEMVAPPPPEPKLTPKAEPRPKHVTPVVLDMPVPSAVVPIESYPPTWLQLYESFEKSSRDPRVKAKFDQIATSVASKAIGPEMFGAEKKAVVADALQYVKDAILRTMDAGTFKFSTGKWVSTHAKGRNYERILEVTMNATSGLATKYGVKKGKLFDYLVKNEKVTLGKSCPKSHDANAYIDALPPYPQCLTLGLVGMLVEWNPDDHEVTADDIAKKLAAEVDDMDFS